MWPNVILAKITSRLAGQQCIMWSAPHARRAHSSPTCLQCLLCRSDRWLQISCSCSSVAHQLMSLLGPNTVFIHPYLQCIRFYTANWNCIENKDASYSGSYLKLPRYSITNKMLWLTFTCESMLMTMVTPCIADLPWGKGCKSSGLRWTCQIKWTVQALYVLYMTQYTTGFR